MHNEIINALFYAGAAIGAALLVFTAAHLTLYAVVAANDAILYRIAKHRGLKYIFLILFSHNRETLKKHISEISDFIYTLENADREEAKKDLQK